MSEFRDRTTRLRPKSRAKSITLLATSILLVFPLVTPVANATGSTPTAAMYLDQPFVEGSYVANDFPTETSVTTFDDQPGTGGACSFVGATVEPLLTSQQDCHVYTPGKFGGAATSGSTPVVGEVQTPTNFAGVGSGGVSIVFNTPQTYFGMWWSAGSLGNQVQLLSGSDIVASTSADDVTNTIGTGTTLTAQNGDTYAKRFYLGNPYGWHKVGEPTDFSDSDSSNTYEIYPSLPWPYTDSDPYEAFVFIHFIAEPGTTFDRVNLVAPGNGFEFDNFTTSSATGIVAAGIPGRLVLQRQIYAPTYVDYEANGGTGAMARQYSVDSAAAYLNYTCMPPYTDSNRCISAPNDSYATQSLGWNTAPDGSGTSYYFDNWQPYSFNESMTVYAQWQTNFSFRYLTYSGTDFSTDVTSDNVWDFVDWDSSQDLSLRNFADLTLPEPTRPDQYLEGWYTYNSDYQLVRAGGPGEVITSSIYTQWDPNMFGHWVNNPPPPTSVDAITPQVIPVYPRSASVTIPSMPITGDTAASICILESDLFGNQVSSDLQFTGLGTGGNSFTSPYSVSTSHPLLSGSSKYIRITVAAIDDPGCSSGTSHIVELRPLGAELSQVLQVHLALH